MPRRTVSMLTEIMAKEGTEFSPYASEKCIHCSLFNVCIGNLRPGAKYRVVKVRSHRNKCPLLSEEMYVVEVEELPVRLVVPSTMAVEGMTITYRRPSACSDEEARKYGAQCNPPYILEGEKAVVKRVVGKLRGGLAVVEAEIVDPPKRELWVRVFPEATPRLQARPSRGQPPRRPQRQSRRSQRPSRRSRPRRQSPRRGRRSSGRPSRAGRR